MDLLLPRKVSGIMVQGDVADNRVTSFMVLYGIKAPANYIAYTDGSPQVRLHVLLSFFKPILILSNCEKWQ